MSSVLTLITAPSAASLEACHIEGARATLADLGATCGPPDWLAPGTACDLAFSGAEPDLVAARMRAVFAGKPIDLAAQPAEGRRKRLLLADMDSTIVTSETLDDLAAFAGVKDQVAAITDLSMNGKIDFASALRERV